MLTLPETKKRKAQPYIYVPFTVTMRQMRKPGREGFPALFAHLEKHGLQPVGAPFYNYRRINMADTLDVEAGIAVKKAGPEHGKVKNGVLPEGQYIGLTWHGSPDKLITVTGILIGWAQLSKQALDVEEKADGDHFACRLEYYETNSEEVPDMNDWVTTLAFKLRD
jgi:hypothetical protein